MTALRVKVKIPKPHSKQRDFINSKAKRKVICAGRRGGKTTGVSILAVIYFLRGKRVLYAAPTSDQTDSFWVNVILYLSIAILLKVVKVNQSNRTIEMIGGTGRIKAKTAWNADTLRGDYADLLILEEFSFMEPDTWSKVGAPMLLDNNGDAVFIFTPNRKNHAYKIYLRAISDMRGRWKAWHFTSYDNPHLSKEALAELKEDMTEEDIKQEIDAQFLEGEGQVFRNIDACSHAPSGSIPKEHEGHTIVGGVDWGKQQDFTAISFGCVNCRREVMKDRFNQIDYAFQLQRLKKHREDWKPVVIKVELNSIGAPLFEQLQRDGLPVVAFETTATSKPPLIEGFSLELERGNIQLIDDIVWRGEMEAYERKVSPVTGHSSYSAPEGMHDDTVIARALMTRAMNETPARASTPRKPDPWKRGQ